MGAMKRAWMAMWTGAMVLVGCGGSPDPLVVKQYTLRDATLPSMDDPMVRGEVLHRLYGAVSWSERLDRLGQYFTVLWSEREGAGEPVRVVFEYQQAASGDKVKRRFQEFASEEVEGKAQFKVIGEDFRKNGRVLAWRISLWRGKKEVASEQSYLWE
jgi:hypothetical protein